MCAAWQIRKVSFEIKQHLLPILNYISDKLCPRPCLNSYSTSFSYFCCQCCHCCFFYFFLVFFRASPCSSSFSLALAALTDLTAQHQLSTLSSPFGSRHCSRPSQALAHFKLLTQKLILASGCCQPSQHSQPASQQATASSQLLLLPAASFSFSFSMSLFLSLSLCRAVHLVAFHSFADCNISLPLRFVCCILSSVAEVCLN